MKTHKSCELLSSGAYQSGHRRQKMKISMYRVCDAQEIEQKLAVLEEWEQVQRGLLAFAFTSSYAPTHSWRCAMEACISRITHDRAKIWWEPLVSEGRADSDGLIEIRYQQVLYGMLDLTSGYLNSCYLPNIPHDFANLCALLLNLIEHWTLVQQVLKPLSPLNTHKSLTAREQDILLSLAWGESEMEAAQRLSIAPTTIRTHRHSLYHRLEVHSPHEAVLRSFALRLLNWLDLPVPS